MRISDWSSDVCSSDLERADDDQCHAQPNHYVIVIEVFRLTPDRRFPNCNALFARRQAFQALHAEPAAEKVVEIEPPGQIKFRRPQGRQFPINQGLHLALIVEHYVGGRSVPPKHVYRSLGRLILKNIIQRRIDIQHLATVRSEEHTSDLLPLSSTSFAVS